MLNGLKAPTQVVTIAPGGGYLRRKDNSILYGVLTLILAVVALVMLQVNNDLRKLAPMIKRQSLHERSFLP